MNVPEESSLTLPLDQRYTSTQAQALFPLVSLQHLDPENAKRCQSILGHGRTYGLWETSEAIVPHMKRNYRRVDLRRRITAYLPDEMPSSPALVALLDEGVLWLTRLALLMRMGPAGVGHRAKLLPLDASSIAVKLYQQLAALVAHGVSRRLECAGKTRIGFAAALTADELQKWWREKYFRCELMRLVQLRDLHLWSDAPVAREFKGKTTPVRGKRRQQPVEKKSNPFPAIPDDYLAVMGPRVLWLIKDLGPNMIHLLDTLPTLLRPGKTGSDSVSLRVSRYFETNLWRDRNGQVIERPALRT